MRINRFVATASGLSRRQADQVIARGRVKVDEVVAKTGQEVNLNHQITLDGDVLSWPKFLSIMLNKPVGYVVSRKGQGALTIYNLLPKTYQDLKPVGRLDKDSSGLLLLSNDGQLINALAHPSFNKQKVYEVTLDRAITKSDLIRLKNGVRLDDGLSKLFVQKIQDKNISVSLHEGRNRQIRRTFMALNYRVIKLHRLAFGPYRLADLKPGQYQKIDPSTLKGLELSND